MPGILGYKGGCPRSVIDTAVLKRMALPICYSPNDRLSIVDYGSFAGAAVDYDKEFSLKSAVSQNSDVCLLIDGEVFPDAGEVPESFRKPVTTIQRAEYCLHLYMKHGPMFVRCLNGSFAIAVYDSRDQTLHLYTDRFLSRPLFFWQKNNDFAFASSVRSLLCCRDDIGREYDHMAIAEFIGFDKVISERTLFADIRRLPPAAHARLRNGKLAVERYFNFDPCAVTDLSSWREAAHKLTDILRRSLEKRVADDSGLGVFLSGGIDSRLILALSPDSVTGLTLTNEGMANKERKLTLKAASTRGIACIELPRTSDYPLLQARASVDINEGVFGSFLACRGVTFFNRLVEAGIHVTITGLYFNQVLKGMFIEDLPPIWGMALLPECVRNRAISRVLSESTLIQETYPLNLKSLGLSDKLKDALAVAKEHQIRRLSQWFSNGGTIGDLADRFPFENLLSVSDLAPTTRTNRTRLVDHSIIYDNELAEFAISIPHKWKRGGRLVMYALRKVSPELAKIEDPHTGLPAGVCPPLHSRTIQGVKDISQDLLKRSSLCCKVRNYLRSRKRERNVHPFNQGAYHDINALLKFSPKYQELVRSSIERLPAELFDIERIKLLLKQDLSAGKPRFGALFTPLVAFSLFDTDWGPNSDRSKVNCYLD